MENRNVRTLALDSTDYLYTPTRNIENLFHGRKLTISKSRSDRKYIRFLFEENSSQSLIEISRGRNGGFITSVIGRPLGLQLSSIENPFCVYVPGIAGIPIQEKFEVPIAIKKSATRGDSNNYLRNILYDISQNNEKWIRFNHSINSIYSDVKLQVYFDKEKSEFIEVNVENNEQVLPIDSIGTGLLQTIQVFAYLEYFNPTLLLLDEPDAHIHPTKQKLLAKEILERSRLNENLKVVFSTHSRYILEALEEDAKVFHFQDGNVFPDIKGSKVLLDIGAADAEYIFSKRNLKFVIVTEDKVDQVKEKKEFLKKLIIANGLTEDEFVLHSYESSSKVNFAKILKGFVAKQIPSIEVIVHIDRDQRLDDDPEIIKLKSDCSDKDIKLFFTEFSEVENYFCQPLHISSLYEIDLDTAEEIYKNCISELEDITRDKLSNFILNSKPHLYFNKDGRKDIRIITEKVDFWYSNFPEILTPGKELLGKIKKVLQEDLKMDPNLILNTSKGLIRKHIQDLIVNIEDVVKEVGQMGLL